MDSRSEKIEAAARSVARNLYGSNVDRGTVEIAYDDHERLKQALAQPNPAPAATEGDGAEARRAAAKAFDAMVDRMSEWLFENGSSGVGDINRKQRRDFIRFAVTVEAQARREGEESILKQERRHADMLPNIGHLEDLANALGVSASADCHGADYAGLIGARLNKIRRQGAEDAERAVFAVIQRHPMRNERDTWAEWRDELLCAVRDAVASAMKGGSS